MEALRGARELATWLASEGHDVRLPESDAEAAGLQILAHPPSGFHNGLDLMVSLGGDGSILHAVHIVSDYGIPILGVNYGELAYLAEIEPRDVREAIRCWLDGDCRTQSRMRLSVHIEQPGTLEILPDMLPASSVARNSVGLAALNEVAVEKVDRGRSISLRLKINGRPFHGYRADGIVVSSPTGSTAYSLSLKGPVLAPELESLLVTPVATHSLFDRSLVLPPTYKVCIEVREERAAAVALDGRLLGSVHPGGFVECSASPHPARLVTFENRVFHDILREKFGLSDVG